MAFQGQGTGDSTTVGVSLQSGRGTVVLTFYAGVAQSRSESSSFPALRWL